MGKTTDNSGVAYWGGQKGAISPAVFGSGGIFDQFLAGKPNAGFDRAQSNALQQLQQQQAGSGTLNTPLGTRQQSDFLQGSTQAAGDQFFQQLSQFMQPAGAEAKSKSAGFWGGKG